MLRSINSRGIVTQVKFKCVLLHFREGRMTVHNFDPFDPQL